MPEYNKIPFRSNDYLSFLDEMKTVLQRLRRQKRISISKMGGQQTCNDRNKILQTCIYRSLVNQSTSFALAQFL